LLFEPPRKVSRHPAEILVRIEHDLVPSVAANTTTDRLDQRRGARSNALLAVNDGISRRTWSGHGSELLFCKGATFARAQCSARWIAEQHVDFGEAILQSVPEIHLRAALASYVDPDRADYIRSQRELHALAGDAPRFPELHLHCDRLWRRNSKRWSQGLPQRSSSVSVLQTSSTSSSLVVSKEDPCG
jgi:hypothetical protein